MDVELLYNFFFDSEVIGWCVRLLFDEKRICRRVAPSLIRQFLAVLQPKTWSYRIGQKAFDRALQDVPNDMYIYWIKWILSHFYSLEKRTTCATGDHLESQSWFLLAVRISRTVTVAQCPPWFDYHYLLGRFWRKTFCSSLSSHGNCQQNPRAGHYQDHDVASATQFVRLFRRDLSWWDQFKLAYLTLSKKFILFGREISENCVVSGVDYLVQHLRQVTEKIPFLSIFFFFWLGRGEWKFPSSRMFTRISRGYLPIIVRCWLSRRGANFSFTRQMLTEWWKLIPVTVLLPVSFDSLCCLM